MLPRQSKPALVTTLVVGLSACSLLPEPAPEATRSEALTDVRLPEQWAAEGAATGNVEHGWLASFNDSHLEALVAEAVVHNADLKAAAARVEKAAAHVRIARGETYPQTDLIARGGVNGSSDSSGLEGVVLGASWELDVWGRVRYGVRGNEDQFAAAESDARFAAQSVAALVAKSWFLLTTTALERSLALEMVQAAERLVTFAEDRRRVGIGSDLDVTSARVSLQTYRDTMLQVELAHQQSARALELLLGRYPEAEITPASQLPPVADGVPAGLPSELLERRPDVIAAERRVAAAFNRLQQSKAARLPRISLTGSASDISSDLFVLKTDDDVMWRAGGSLFAPLFTGGALRAQVLVRTAEQKEALSAYAAAALSAFADVENALSGDRNMQSREAVLTVALDDAQRALRIAETRYRIGSGDLRDIERQQLSYYGTRLNLLRVQNERRMQRVNLHLALGGDFDERS
jgi:NodT family efflux transporter outer membrane factor (OMF) lipoprotein